jgi:hypothetical protein
MSGVIDHSLHSVLREQVVEHLLIGRLLQRLWVAGNTQVEVLRSEFDRGGYDVVFTLADVVRHVQLKCSRLGGTTRNQKISLNLAKRPSGCVVWLVVNDHLEFAHLLWFGGEPGKPLPDISMLKIAKHNKGNAEGAKLERPNLRVLGRANFRRLEGLDDLLDCLFGPTWREGDRAEAC